jgi:hypothetical protein
MKEETSILPANMKESSSVLRQGNNDSPTKSKKAPKPTLNNDIDASFMDLAEKSKCVCTCSGACQPKMLKDLGKKLSSKLLVSKRLSKSNMNDTQPMKRHKSESLKFKEKPNFIQTMQAKKNDASKV